MSDEENTTISEEALDSSDEAGATKIWTIYVSEAEKYDRSLVESWKSDMEGMLIFAGLFSASLTAFIIESYKTLVPDSGDATVQILTQISQQLAAAANGSAFEPPAPTDFTPSTLSLICNALWFISLGLSLACALIATLLEQWARDFLHRADMRSAPIIRARIFSYLYYGLKRFNMHTIVDIIPLLLHASLFLFFAGLVAFLLPINVFMAAVAAVLVALLVVVYLLFTLLPLWYLDCPYRTPLSTTFWRISQSFTLILRRRHESGSPVRITMVETMSRRATEESPGRFARDYRALEWTVKSLADDAELEPFVESLPDLLWGPSSRRFTYDEHIQKLIRAADLKLQSRIEGLLRSCDSGLLAPEAGKRRQITCYKALWAIASLQPFPQGSNSQDSLDFTHLVHYTHSQVPVASLEPEVLHYSVSATALLRWSTFCAVKSHLATLMDYLVRCSADPDGCNNAIRNLHPIILNMTIPSLSLFPPGYGLRHYLSDLTVAPASLSDIISDLIQLIEEFSLQTPYEILFSYLEDCAQLQSQPHRWHNTQTTISLSDQAPFSAISHMLVSALGTVVYRRPLHGFSAATDDFNDMIVQMLCYHWHPHEPVPVPHGIIHYLNNRNGIVLKQFLTSTHIGMGLWNSFPLTLFHGPASPQSSHLDALEEAKTALWCLACITPSLGSRYPPALYEAVLEVVEAFSLSSPVIFSIDAMVKSRILDSLFYCHPHRAPVPPLRHSLLPKETAIAISFRPEFLDAEVDHPEFVISDGDVSDLFHLVLHNRIVEAQISVIAEFLDGFRSNFIPYKAAETLHRLCDDVPTLRAEIHESHQIRFANGMHRMIDSDDTANLLDTIISSGIFDLYFDAGIRQVDPDGRHRPFNSQPDHAWLHDSSARERIQKVLTDYAIKLGDSDTSLRVRAILAGLKSLHKKVGSYPYLNVPMELL